MESHHEVLDISSDEEEEEGLGGERADWLASMLEKDDSDEIMVIGEVIASSNHQQSSSSSKLGDLDDDCLILDGDPDQPVEVENDAGSGSDELQVVSEKGQVACRDYPHPRHLCARYPFSSNPHEKYCDLCHCYVCDTRAPCAYWGTGVSSRDHCHSSDKEEIWRVHRKLIKQGKTAPLPAPNHPEITSSMALPLHKPIPAVTLVQPPNNRNIPPHTSKSNTLRPCSSTSNFGVPSIISQRNQQQRGDALLKSMLPHPGMSKSTSLPAGTSSTVNNVQRHKGTVGSNLGPRFVSPHVNFKRVGAVGVTLTKSGSGHGTHSNTNHIYNHYLLQQQRNQQSTVTYNGVQSTSSHELRPCQSASQRQRNHYTSVTYNGIQCPRSQELNTRQSASQQEQMNSHTAVAYIDIPSPRIQEVNTCKNVAQQQQPNNHTAIAYNSIQSPRSQEVNTCQNVSQLQQPNSHTAIAYNGIPSSRSLEANTCQSASQPSISGSLTDSQPYNVSLQPQAYSQPIPQLSDDQNSYLPVNPAVTMTNQNISDVQLSWFSDSLPSARPGFASTPVIDPIPQCPGAASTEDFDLDSWIQSLHQPELDTGKETMSSGLGFIPSQTELSEAMLMFDFETTYRNV